MDNRGLLVEIESCDLALNDFLRFPITNEDGSKILLGKNQILTKEMLLILKEYQRKNSLFTFIDDENLNKTANKPSQRRNDTLRQLGLLDIQLQNNHLGIFLPEEYNPDVAEKLIKRLNDDQALGKKLADICTEDFDYFMNAYSFQDSLIVLKNAIKKLYQGDATIELNILKDRTKSVFMNTLNNNRNYFPDRIAYSTYLRSSQGDYTYVHSLNTAKWAILFASLINIENKRKSKGKKDEKDIFIYNHEEVALSALLHDAGKLYSPIQEIIIKPRKISSEEYELVKQHTRIGSDYLGLYESIIGTKTAIVALQHHERVSGQGYLQGLEDFETDPLSALIATADCFEAMFFRTHYRDVFFNPSEIYNELTKELYRSSIIDAEFDNKDKVDDFFRTEDFSEEPFFMPCIAVHSITQQLSK